MQPPIRTSPRGHSICWMYLSDEFNPVIFESNCYFNIVCSLYIMIVSRKHLTELAQLRGLFATCSRKQTCVYTVVLVVTRVGALEQDLS